MATLMEKSIIPVFRSAQEQQEHDDAVRKLAAIRFAIPDWKVALNLGSGANDQSDIVAVNDGKIVAIGEVETETTINREQAVHWKSMAELSPRFYLFVPEGTEEVTKKLIEEYKICCAGLRSYKSSDGELSVRSVYYKNVECRPDDHSWWRQIGRRRDAS